MDRIVRVLEIRFKQRKFYLQDQKVLHNRIGYRSSDPEYEGQRGKPSENETERLWKLCFTVCKRNKLHFT